MKGPVRASNVQALNAGTPKRDKIIDHLSVRCPECNARVSKRCISKTNSRISRPHVARTRLANRLRNRDLVLVEEKPAPLTAADVSTTRPLGLTPCQVNQACKPEKCQHEPSDQHPDDWFEDPGSGQKTPEGRRRRRALQACWTECPMKARLGCLDEGLKPENLSHGVWGGYTEAERQEIHEGLQKRRQRRTNTPA